MDCHCELSLMAIENAREALWADLTIPELNQCEGFNAHPLRVELELGGQ